MSITDPTTWTFGVEHELADWDRSKELPPGCKVDRKDHTIVNSNGIAADPKGKYYGFGGEINTPPTDYYEEQVDILGEILERFPDARVNYRSNLHWHIRVPGLSENLDALKRVQAYIHEWMPKVLPIIEPIPQPTREEYPDEKAYAGAKRRARRRKVSHHTLLTKGRLAYQLEATTLLEFFEREVPLSKLGERLWTTQPRCCVNLRQLRETDTVEFRHWPGTLDGRELELTGWWCGKFMAMALGHSIFESPLGLAEQLIKERAWSGEFPTFPQYDHSMEIRYRATVNDGTVKPEDIRKNIQQILDGTFVESEHEFETYSRRVSREREQVGGVRGDTEEGSPGELRDSEQGPESEGCPSGQEDS